MIKGHFFGDDSDVTKRPDAKTYTYFLWGFLPTFLGFLLNDVRIDDF